MLASAQERGATGVPSGGPKTEEGKEVVRGTPPVTASALRARGPRAWRKEKTGKSTASGILENLSPVGHLEVPLPNAWRCSPGDCTASPVTRRRPSPSLSRR